MITLTKGTGVRSSRIENDPWSFGTDDHNERRRLFQCYMYLCLNDDPQANHYSIPLPLAPIFDGHTLELVELQRLPTGKPTSLIRRLSLGTPLVLSSIVQT